MSTLHQQLEASHEKLDAEGISAATGLKLEPNTASVKQRKPRSNKGVPKPPKPITEALTLTITGEHAREIGYALTATGRHELANEIHGQVIAQLQKRIDALQKSPK